MITTLTTDVVRCGDNYLYLFQGRAERAGRRTAVIPREITAPAGRSDGAARSAGGRDAPAGHSPRPDWQLRLCTLRRTAGCRPSATPGTARHRLAAVTPADRTRVGPAILPALQCEAGQDHPPGRFASHVMASGHPCI